MLSELFNSPQFGLEESTCESAGCNNPAIKKIPVNAGTFGILDVLVCIDCVSKFQEDDNDD